MSHVFEKTSIAGMDLKNRILRSATHEGMGDEQGYPRKELLDIYKKIAKNNGGGTCSPKISGKAEPSSSTCTASTLAM